MGSISFLRFPLSKNKSGLGLPFYTMLPCLTYFESVFVNVKTSPYPWNRRAGNSKRHPCLQGGETLRARKQQNRPYSPAPGEGSPTPPDPNHQIPLSCAHRTARPTQLFPGGTLVLSRSRKPGSTTFRNNNPRELSERAPADGGTILPARGQPWYREIRDGGRNPNSSGPSSHPAPSRARRSGRPRGEGRGQSRACAGGAGGGRARPPD